MKVKLIFFFLIGLSANIFALDVSVYPAVFYEGDQGYVEMHYYFSGGSLGWKSVDDSLMESSAQVLITFSQGEVIFKYDKYNLRSPKFFGASDFRDIHRYSLKPGKYQVDIKIEDGLRATNKVSFKTSVTIAPPKEVMISDIVLLSEYRASTTDTPFDKYGYHMEALPYNFVNKDTRSFVVYAEIYNTDKMSEEKYSLRLQFNHVDENEKKPYQGFTKKRTVKKKDIYLKKVKADFMPSGAYSLTLEVRNSAGIVVAKKTVEFQRDNHRMNKTTTIADLSEGKGNFIESLSPKELDYYLTALLPTIEGQSLNTLQTYFKEKNFEGKKQFLYSHFVKKDPINPAGHFYAFAKLAKQVDKAFYNAHGAGFETDRGVIFMKYGKPNDQVKVENEQFALPYEIWVYESLPDNKTSPVKFLFYNRDNVGENFTLLHSNARGERRNRNWKQELFRKDTLTGFNTTDDRMKATEVDDSYNEHPNSMAIRYFQDL